MHGMTLKSCRSLPPMRVAHRLLVSTPAEATYGPCLTTGMDTGYAILSNPERAMNSAVLHSSTRLEQLNFGKGRRSSQPPPLLSVEDNDRFVLSISANFVIFPQFHPRNGIFPALMKFPKPEATPHAFPLIAALFCLGATPLFAQVDLDTDDNELSDVWEIRYFGSTGQDKNADVDGDGANNKAESGSNTNPRDRNDFLHVLDPDSFITGDTVSFTTVTGKKYRLDVSGNLADWSSVEESSGVDLDFFGSGGILNVDFTNSASPKVTGAVTREVWLQAPPSGTSDLKTYLAGAGAPDGTEWRSSLKGPSDYGDNFSARYAGFIVPKETGNFTFHIAGRGVCEFHFNSSGPGPTPALAAEIDLEAEAAGINEEEWDHVAGLGGADTQKSPTYSLVAGTRYYFEVFHVDPGGGTDHIAVGWDTPSSTGIEIVPGDCLSPEESFTSSNGSVLFDGAGTKFVRVAAYEFGDAEVLDSDGDGIDDATENELLGFGFSPFSASSPGHGEGSDADKLAALLGFDPASQSEEVSVEAIDSEAIELENPPLLPGNIVDIGNLGSQSGTSQNKIRFKVKRNGGLGPVTVYYTLGGATLAEEVSAAPGVDYTALEEGDEPADGVITIPAGSADIDVEVTVSKDNTHEYPETVSLAVDPHADYVIAPGAAVAKGEICDMPADVNLLFVGAYQEDFNATAGTGRASGTVSGYLRGDKRTFVLRNDNFSNLTAPQNDTHFHKVLLSGGNPVGGPPIHDILNQAGTDALLGHYLTYEWDLTHQNPIVPTGGGAPSRQTVIDSLFNQNGQTQIYVNLHTDDNAAGEVMAMLELASGSSTEPDPPGDPDPVPLLSGAELESEITRFLNQATFGAAWEDVQAIKTSIETKRGSNSNYSRLEEFEIWIDEQCKIQQTYLVDYVLAADSMEWNLRGFYDPSEWNDWDTFHAGIDVQPIPTNWAYIDRSLTNATAPGMPNVHPHFWANQWYPVNRYPNDRDWINWRDDTSAALGTKVKRNLGDIVQNNRRRAHWALMVNGNDQLRQKFGNSIQQLLVVAETLNTIRIKTLGAANYQDMLNYYGLPTDRDGSGQIDANEEVYFRDLFGFVNWSPIMGKWLSSLKNRAAYDSNGNGIIDVYPDENLAREDMQLFSIGLFNLWPDGSLQLQAGEDPNVPPGSSATYTNDDIQEFARVLTGQSFSRYVSDSRSNTRIYNNQGFREGPYQFGIDGADNGNVFDTDNSNNDSDANDGDDGILYNNNFTAGEGESYYGHQFNYPMRMFGKSGNTIYHDLGVKTIAGGRVIDNTSMLSNTGNPPASSNGTIINMGKADIEDALDWFAGKVDGNAGPDFTGDAGNPNASHASTPAFVSRRLIQRMTTSNPSSAYLYRVSKAFKDSEGCMRDVCKAILLDPEVRNPALISESYGMKKPPMDSYMQLLRTFEAFSLLPISDDNSMPPFNGNWPGEGGFDPGDYTNNDQYHEIFLTDYGYPDHQANNFRMNCHLFYNNTDNQLSMSPFAQETVFNYYLPNFSKGVVQSAALVSPELQIATETEVVNNINFFWTITWAWDGNRDRRADGQSFNRLGGTTQNQREAFNGGVNSGGDWDQNHRIRIDFQKWADEIYSLPPFSGNNIPGSGGRSSESLEDEALVDFIDRRLMAGQFRQKYPFDVSDDEDPSRDGFSPRNPLHGDGNLNNDLDGRNPREWIIHTLTDSFGDGTSSAGNRMNKFRSALYLMTISPEYQVKK